LNGGGPFGIPATNPFNLGDGFDYRLIGRATQSLTQNIEEFTVDGINVNDQLTEYGNPEWRLTLTNTLRWKDFGFLFQSRYLSSMVENVIPEERNERVTTFFSRCVLWFFGYHLSASSDDQHYTLHFNGIISVSLISASTVLGDSKSLVIELRTSIRGA